MNRLAFIMRVGMIAILLAGFLLQPQSTVYAAGFTIEPITWNVIGLDSNDPGTGPYHFPVGVRVCNDTGAVANNVTGEFVWDGGGTASATEIYNRAGTNTTLSVATLAAGACTDFYYEVEVSRTLAPYDKTRRYHIEVTSTETGATIYYSDMPRELYVEHLISQNRNGVEEIYLDSNLISAGGTMYLQVGHTYDITLNGFTATQGYNQFEAFINLPNTVFQINSVTTDYAANTSTIVTPSTNYPYLYADACGWDSDPNSPTYRSCIVDSLAKTGGNPVSTTYNVTILPSSITSGTLNTLLYDFSGSSYHYNADFGVEYYFQIVDPTQATINKSFNPRTYNPGSVDHSTVTITLSNPTGVTVSGVHFTDVFPTLAGGAPGDMTVYDATTTNTCGGNLYDSNAGTDPINAGDPGFKLVGGSIAPNGTCTITVNVKVSANGDYTNNSGELWVDVGGVDTNTHKSDDDMLRVSSTPPPPSSCTTSTPLVTWGFNAPTFSLGVPTFPINGTVIESDVSNPLATYAFGTANYQKTGIADTSGSAGALDTIPSANNASGQSWGIQSGTNAADPGGWWIDTTTPNASLAPYFQFQLDAGNYGGLTLDAVANLQGSWANSGYIYVFSSTSVSGPWTLVYATAPAWDTPNYKNAFGSIPQGTIFPANAGTTYFRVVINGASKNKTDPTIFIDNVTIYGCKNPPEPNFSKAFKDPTGTTDVTAIAQGTTSRLIFAIDNTNASVPGSVNLTDLAFIDTLPSGLTITSGTQSVCGGTNNLVRTAPNTIELLPTGTGVTGGSVNANNICTFFVDVTGTSAGHYDNVTGYLSSTETGTTTKYAEDTLNVAAPPVISKAFSPTSILVNGNSTLSFTVTNPNNFTSLTGVAFTDSGAGWPAALSATNGTYNGTCTAGSSGSLSVTGGNSVSLSGGTLAANGSCTFSVPVTSANVGAWTNTTSAVTATGPIVLTGNTASATLTVNAPKPLISLNKEISTDNTNWYKYVGLVPSPTTQVWYRFTLSNEGEADLAGVKLTDPNYQAQIDAACSSLNPSGAGTALTVADPGNVITCTIGPISVTGAPTPNPYINTATVTTTTYTPSIPVTSDAKYGTESITIAKYVTETYFTAAGDTLHYRYEVTNNGSYPLVGPITVHDDKITPDITCQGPATVGDNDSYFDPGETVLCPGPVDTDFVAYTVTAADVTAKQVVNTAHGIATLIGGGTIDSPDTSKTVPLAPDLTVSKINSITGDTTNGSTMYGNTFVWTLTVTNAVSAGPASFASGQTILSDDLPSTGATYSVGTVTYTGTTGTVSCSIATNTLTCTASGGAVTIPSGASFSVPVTVTPTASGTFTNPRSGGTCKVDPTTPPATGLIVELDDTNNDCNTNTVTVTPVADLSINKDDGNTTYTAGGIVTYTVTVTNNGPSDVTGATVEDVLPVQINSWAWVCTSEDGGASGCTPSASSANDFSDTVDLPIGGSIVYTVTADVDGAATGDLVNTATVTEPVGVTDPTPGNNSSTDTDTLAGTPGLTITKAYVDYTDNDSNGIISAGDDLNYTVTGSNTGDVALSNVVVSDVQLTPNSQTCATLAVGADCVLSGSYTVTAGDVTNGSFSNTAYVTSTEVCTGATECPDTVTVPIPQPAINIVKSPATQNVISGGTANFTLTVTNTGNIALTGITVTDAQCTTGPTYTGGDTNGDSQLQLTETWIYTCSVTNVTADFTNTASVDTTEGVTDSDTADVTVSLQQVDLELAKSVSNTTPLVATNITFTVAVTNVDSVDATGVEVTDILPAGFTYVTDNSGGAYNSGTGVWNIGTVPANSSVSLTITVTVNITGPYTNYAEITAMDQVDPDSTPNNNSTTEDDDDSVTVTPTQNNPNLGKTVSGTNQTFTAGSDVAIGEIVTYTVTITVPPGTFDNAQLVDTMDRGLSFMSCSSITAPNLTTNVADSFAGACSNPTVDDASGGTTVDVGRRVRFVLGTLTNASGADQTLTFEYTAVVLDSAANVTGKNLTNSAVWSSDQSGVLSSVTATVRVLEPELSIAKTSNTSLVSVGSEVTITLTIQHTGASRTNAYDTVVTDVLPAELDMVPGTLECVSGAQNADACTYNTGARTVSATWNNFALGGGNGRVTFRVTVVSLPASGVSNTANVAWTSLPGDVSTPQNSNVFSKERGYDPASQIDIYGTSDTLLLNVFGNNNNSKTLLPATGFAPNVVTDVSGDPAIYTPTGGLTVEIPALNLNIPIVGVPLKNGEWDVSWLANQAGWLEGSAFPTWSGNSVLTGHVYGSNGLPGPFVNLSKLKYGDKIIIHAYGKVYTYEVRVNSVVEPSDASVFRHEDKAWLTLVTCKEYDEKTNTYKKREVVRAVLVSVGSK